MFCGGDRIDMCVCMWIVGMSKTIINVADDDASCDADADVDADDDNIYKDIIYINIIECESRREEEEREI